jgi:hypothetical protein
MYSGLNTVNFLTRYPIIRIIEKLTRRNQKTNQLLFFLPEITSENCKSISQAKTRNGNPRSNVICENLIISSGER